jgi:diguanylate cyclase (GGDEF)-like protein
MVSGVRRTVAEGGSVAAISRVTPVEARGTGLLQGVAVRDIPLALLVTGAVVLVVGVINFLLSDRSDITDVIPDAIVAAGLIAWSVLLRRRNFGGGTVQWSYAFAMVLVVGWLLNEFRLQPDTANMAYVVVVMSVFGPLVLAWFPFATASAVMVAGATTVLIASGWGDARGWIAAYVVAVSAGGLLLSLRLRSLSELAVARAAAERMATTDPLTGVLNRHGLELMAPVLVASAKRYGQPMVVWFADIDGLKAANDGYGHALGDHIITVVADAITASTREGDLVARWGGDEFVIVGLGIESTANPLERRVHEQIRFAGIDTGRWVGTVTFGSASHMPQVATLQELIAEADHAMYRVRHSV